MTAIKCRKAEMDKTNNGAGAMAQQVRYLVLRHEDLRSVPSTHGKARCSNAHLPPAHWGCRDRRICAGLLASLVNW